MGACTPASSCAERFRGRALGGIFSPFPPLVLHLERHWRLGVVGNNPPDLPGLEGAANRIVARSVP